MTSFISSFFSQIQRVFCLPQNVLCLPPCSENIINYFAFCPPQPSYQLYYNEKLSKYEFAYVKQPSELPHFINVLHINDEMEFSLVKTKYYSNIACLYYAANPKSKLTILYSHGNSCDLGDMICLCVFLAKELRCNILTYDYSGYGCSTGKPSERQIYADIEAAALHLIQRYGLSFGDIVLHGQSLGCAPTVDLASRLNVRGVVIQSGFTSAISVPFPKMQNKAKRWDLFRSIDSIERVAAPTLIIHGTDDKIVNFSHGVDLYNKCRMAVEPLWIEGAGHANIESFDIFIERMKSFLEAELRPVSFPKHNSRIYTLTSRHSAQSPFHPPKCGSRKSCCRHHHVS